MISVIVADDDDAVRSALALVLEKKLNILHLSQAANMDELLFRVPETGPALVLLDWELPGLEAAGGVAALRRLRPDLKVAALSARCEARQAALAAGVEAFISKTESPESVVRAISALHLDLLAAADAAAPEA